MMTVKTTLLAAFATTLIFSGFANAAEFEIKMLNKGTKGAMVFEPDFIKAAQGDTIKFVVVDKGHDVQSIKGMIPDGVEMFKGEMGKEFSLTVTSDGIYGVKCAPHYGMGMVALIAVGTPANLEASQAVKHPGKAKKTFAELFVQLAAAQ